MAAGRAEGTAVLGGRGKTVHPALVVLLSIVTFGVYYFFFWWRVTREADGLHGQAEAHPLARIAIIMSASAGVAVIILLVALFATAGTLTADTGEEIAQELAGSFVAIFVLVILAALVAVAGSIMLLVAQYRSWHAIRQYEVAAGRRNPVNPPLYLWLPLGLSFAGIIPFIGVVFSLAATVLQLVFTALTQSHLNDIWSGPSGRPMAGALPS